VAVGNRCRVVREPRLPYLIPEVRRAVSPETARMPPVDDAP